MKYQTYFPPILAKKYSKFACRGGGGGGGGGGVWYRRAEGRQAPWSREPSLGPDPRTLDDDLSQRQTFTQLSHPGAPEPLL